MKKIAILFLLISKISYSQVGIGTVTPRGALEISSSKNGFLTPRVALTAANVAAPVVNPQTGAIIAGTIVWNTATAGSTPNKVAPGLYYWDGARWVSLTGLGSKDWSITGNEGTTAGTNFLGTTDDKALYFKTYNRTTGILDHNKALTLFSYNSGTAITGLNNTGFGFTALKSTSSGVDNTAIGESSLKANTTGNRNTGVGSNSLEKNTTGSNNTSVGDGSSYNITTGGFNIAIGSPSLYSNMSGSNNVAIGKASLNLNTASDNTAIGSDAMYSNTTGTLNTAIGHSSLYNSTGNNNSTLGYQTLYRNTTGAENTAIGIQSLWDNNTGGQNTALGTYAYSTFGATTSFSNSTALGHNAQITASNQVRVGASWVTSIGGSVDWTTVSDKKFKKDIQENVIGLEFIKKLRPVTYHLDITSINKALNILDSHTNKQAISEKESVLQTGFIAQEVETAAKQVGFDFSGIDKPKNDSDYYGLRYAEFVVPLVKAMQEQQEMIETLKQQNKALENRLKAIEAKLNQTK